MAEHKTVLGPNLETLTVIPADKFPGFFDEYAPDENGTISVSNLMIDAGPVYIFNESLQRHLDLKRVCFSGCIFLQGIRFEAPQPGLSVSFSECRSPSVHVRGFKSGYGSCLVAGCYFERFSFEGFIHHLHLRATPEASGGIVPNRLRLDHVFLSGEIQELSLDVPISELTMYLGNETRPQLMSNFSVAKQIKTSSLDWAEYLSLACPATPIYIIPVVDETSGTHSILQQIADHRQRGTPRKRRPSRGRTS